MKKIFLIISLITLFPSSLLLASETGKISGIITDQVSGEPMVGVNVFIEGTYLGAASDQNGYYAILNVNPGHHQLKASMMGFATVLIKDVRVEIDLTSFVDIQLQKEAIEGKVVVVIAEKKMVRVDVASSQKSISSESIAQLAVSSVSDVIGLQAGVSGFSVRGGSYNETMFMVDGIALSDERTSDPTTTIP